MRLRIVLAVLASLAAVPLAHACGYMPFSEQSEGRAHALRVLLRADALPLLSPNWHREYWLIAWARTQGKRFSEREVESLTNRPWLDGRFEPDRVRAAISAWTEAREAFGASRLEVSAYHPGGADGYRLVCKPDAFYTAADTLRARATNPDEARRWLEAQDLVFAACSGRAPRPDDDSLSGRERQDRAYQVAKWAEYSGDLEAARAAWAAIEPSSSWYELAQYNLARTGDCDLPALEQLRGRLRQAKARRGVRQLIDRCGLFHEPPQHIVRVLSLRMLNENLGADLPRTLRDIVHFARRITDRCVQEPALLLGCEGTEDATSSSLTRLRFMPLRTGEDMPSLDWLAEETPLLALNAAFHRARHALWQGRRREARRDARRVLALADDSTRSTQNAAAALALAVGIRPLRQLTRHSLDGPTLHADGRLYLARQPVRVWRSVTRRMPNFAGQIRRYELVRAAARGQRSAMRRAARAIAADGEGSLERRLREALALRGLDEELALLSVVLDTDMTSVSITGAFGAHQGATQTSGCRFGQCDDHHPSDTALSLVGPSETERDHRLDALGRRVLQLARRHPEHAAIPALLHRFVRLTRRASVHYVTSPQTGELSHAAFDRLHAHHAESEWTAQTRYWYR